MSASRVATLLGAAVLGVVVAVTGLLEHRNTVLLGDVALPWGLLLALGTAFFVVVAVGSVAGPTAAAIAAVTWVGCVLVVLQGRREGDFLLAADALGQGFAWGGLVTVAAAFVLAARVAATRR